MSSVLDFNKYKKHVQHSFGQGIVLHHFWTQLFRYAFINNNFNIFTEDISLPLSVSQNPNWYIDYISFIGQQLSVESSIENIDPSILHTGLLSENKLIYDNNLNDVISTYRNSIYQYEKEILSNDMADYILNFYNYPYIDEEDLFLPIPSDYLIRSSRLNPNSSEFGCLYKTNKKIRNYNYVIAEDGHNVLYQYANAIHSGRKEQRFNVGINLQNLTSNTNYNVYLLLDMYVSEPEINNTSAVGVLGGELNGGTTKQSVFGFESSSNSIRVYYDSTLQKWVVRFLYLTYVIEDDNNDFSNKYLYIDIHIKEDIFYLYIYITQNTSLIQGDPFTPVLEISLSSLIGVSTSENIVTQYIKYGGYPVWYIQTSGSSSGSNWNNLITHFIFYPELWMLRTYNIDVTTIDSSIDPPYLLTNVQLKDKITTKAQYLEFRRKLQLSIINDNDSVNYSLPNALFLPIYSLTYNFPSLDVYITKVLCYPYVQEKEDYSFNIIDTTDMRFVFVRSAEEYRGSDPAISIVSDNILVNPFLYRVVQIPEENSGLNTDISILTFTNNIYAYGLPKNIKTSFSGISTQEYIDDNLKGGVFNSIYFGNPSYPFPILDQEVWDLTKLSSKYIRLVVYKFNRPPVDSSITDTSATIELWLDDTLQETINITKLIFEGGHDIFIDKTQINKIVFKGACVIHSIYLYDDLEENNIYTETLLYTGELVGIDNEQQNKNIPIYLTIPDDTISTNEIPVIEGQSCLYYNNKFTSPIKSQIEYNDEKYITWGIDSTVISSSVKKIPLCNMILDDFVSPDTIPYVSNRNNSGIWLSNKLYKFIGWTNFTIYKIKRYNNFINNIINTYVSTLPSPYYKTSNFNLNKLADTFNRNSITENPLYPNEISRYQLNSNQGIIKIDGIDFDDISFNIHYEETDYGLSIIGTLSFIYNGSMPLVLNGIVLSENMQIYQDTETLETYEYYHPLFIFIGDPILLMPNNKEITLTFSINGDIVYGE